MSASDVMLVVAHLCLSWCSDLFSVSPSCQSGDKESGC